MKTGRYTATRSGFTWVDGVILLAGIAVVLLALPFLLKPRVSVSRSACPANLKQLEGAKDTWALEHKKLPPDIPTDSELFGTNRYIYVKPVCPVGGTYTLGMVREKPRCSVPGHTL